VTARVKGAHTGTTGGDEAPRPPAEKVTPRAARKAKKERERALSEGLRYSGSRRRWLLMAGALGLSPLLSLAALVVALGKPSRSNVREQVKAELINAGSQFPRGEAVMWAGQVARIWGTWDEKSTGQRAVALAPYLSLGMDNQAGWNGRGVQQVLYASVNPEPQVRDATHAAIGVVFQIQDGTWRCVALPIFAYKPKDFGDQAPWAFALAANPAPTACSPRTGAPSLPGGGGRNDNDGANDLRNNFLPGFFAAWAASDQAALRQYTVSGLRTMGLGGAYLSSPLPQVGDVKLRVPAEGSQERLALVPVTWTVPGSQATLTAIYEVPLVKRGAQWFVTGEPTPAVQDSGVNSGRPGNTPIDPQGEGGSGAYPNPTPSTVSPPPSFRGSPAPSTS
jgi:hypothetical protein